MSLSTVKDKQISSCKILANRYILEKLPIKDQLNIKLFGSWNGVSEASLKIFIIAVVDRCESYKAQINGATSLSFFDSFTMDFSDLTL